MLRVAVTGGIGSGKSTVAALLAARGALVVDADALARQALAPGSEGEREVMALFGPEVVAADGRLDRAALAQRVFSDPQARRQLEAVVHPRVRAGLVAAWDKAPPDAVVVYDVPLLVETGQEDQFDVVVAVEASRQVRLIRLAERGTDRSDAESRMAQQAGDTERRAAADVVLVNDGSLSELTKDVDRLWATWTVGATS